MTKGELLGLDTHDLSAFLRSAMLSFTGTRGGLDEISLSDKAIFLNFRIWQQTQVWSGLRPLS